jgi:resuscitation-promoting factor RpfB
VRPSPARAEAPEPDAWLPILDLGALDAELADLEQRLHEPSAAPTLLRPPDPIRAPLPALSVSPPVQAAPSAPPAPVGPDPATDTPRPPAQLPLAQLRLAQPQLAGRVARRLLLGTVLGLVVAAIPFFLGARPQHRVTLRLDGQEYARTTRAATVGSFLSSEGVRPRLGDRIVPVASTRLRNGLAMHLVRAFPVGLDVDGTPRTVHTTRISAIELRRELGLPATMEVASAPKRLAAGAKVVFRTPHTVLFAIDGFDGAVRTTGLTVHDLLHEHAVLLGPSDVVSPDSAARVADGMIVAVARAAPDSPTDDVAVPFITQQRTDTSLEPGRTRVVQEGADGLDRITYRVLVRGGRVVGRTVISTITIRKPEPRIVAVGPPASESRRPAVAATAHLQEGPASWYGTLHRPGTCAHLEIAVGTAVRVVNTATGAWTTCLVADRGPEAWTGNVIDLAPDVFSRIGLLSQGVIPVRLEW